MKILYEDNDYKSVLFISGNALTLRYYNENGTTREEVTIHKDSAQVTAVYPRGVINVEVGAKAFVIVSSDSGVLKATYDRLIESIFG